MFHLFLCTILLCLNALTAYQIDNIEFQLPTVSSSWELSRTVDNPHGSALIFTAEEDCDDMDYSNNFGFSTGAHPVYHDCDDAYYLYYSTLHHLPYTSNINPKDLEQQLELVFPFLKYQFYLVEQDDDSALLEFYGFDEDGFVLYGMLRKMRAENGTVTLTCIVDEDSAITRSRTACYTALQGATAIY